MAKPEASFEANELTVKIFPDRLSMGQAAARAGAEAIRKALRERNEMISVAFAAAPSQNEFLDALVKQEDIEWQKVRAFQLCEYVGLPPDAPSSFAAYLRRRVFSKRDFGEIHYLCGDTESPESEASRYAELLKDHPLDIAFIGIGENGHLAFNDPPVADFDDPLMAKVVAVDERSRLQQVTDGRFRFLEEVPVQALTLTIPVVFSAKDIYCMVPGKTKAEAVRETVKGQVSPDCPATILRRHPSASLYLDWDSAGLLRE